MISKLILLALPILGLGMALAQHGEKKKGKYNAWSNIIALIIYYWLYYNVGLFDTV